MKRSFLMILFACLVVSVYARGKKEVVYGVAFYNLENMFDTKHDEGKNDYEYLPDGRNQWDDHKYQSKLQNMSKVLGLLATDKVAEGPAIIGMSEIENRAVLEDLLEQPALADRGYEIIHYEGEDQRGIECAFFYNPKLFELKNSLLVPYVYLNDSVRKTRGFLIADGMMGGEHFAFIVNHWPSRGAESPARERAGVQVRALKDSLQRIDPQIRIVIMGDMNDDPMDKSMAEALGAKREMKETGKQDLYNPWWDTLAGGEGTLKYRGKWNLFDQIVFTGNLLKGKKKHFRYKEHEIFKRDFLFQTDGKYKGYPFRTRAGNRWMNGYSDHLPTIVYFVKKQ
ncbi:endonuclease/exonuclease/phosphatase family protein [uncultured Bacteroides sp.]|uniref:endonuclease/exonuclease/phosphatase family protein n=1 Tax=uncultured Bacteroides sp. TaxID=162156 RepID=UPI00262B3546|nr:endonuclease/exonuclease/phosphatase family protein [uncultured Bacteroides sp.]